MSILFYMRILIICIGAVFLMTGVSFASDFSLHGYFRDRVVGNENLDLQDRNNTIPYSNNRFGFISYNQMRLRLEPNFKLNDNLALHAQFDVLDNVLFGTNTTRELKIIAPVMGEQTLPPGAGSFYMSGPTTTGDNGAINVRRVWGDIFTPIGQFRIGRQPSNWGLGIFQNDGNGLQDDFGDSADRILYLFQRQFGRASAISGGLLWDIAYEAQWDPRISGYPANMPSNSRDTQQYAGLLMFDRPEFTTGLFGGLRRRNGPDGGTTMTVMGPTCTTPGDVTNPDCSVASGIDGDTMLYFVDLYARYAWQNYKFQFEGIYIGGKVTTGLALNAIPFSGLTAGQGIIQLPPKQDAQILMAAFEGEAKYDFGGTAAIQAGYASGDGTPLSQRVTQLGFRPDYQIALMLFHMPLGSSPSLYGQRAGAGPGTVFLAGGQPVTGNYVNNAFYVTAGYKHEFDVSNTGWANWVKVGGKAITAWAPKKNTNIDFASLISQAGNWPTLTEKNNSMFKRWYGLEFDLSGEAELFDHLYTALDAGILFPGLAYAIDLQTLPPGSIIEPIPRDMAEMAWMIRLSTIFQF